LCLVITSGRHAYARELLSTAELARLASQLQRAKERVQRFSSTYDAACLFGVLQPEVWAFEEAVDRLIDSLTLWKKMRRRNVRRSYWSRLHICAQVLGVTGQPHDDLVAYLWCEVERDKKRTPPTADVVRHFRQKNASMIEKTIDDEVSQGLPRSLRRSPTSLPKA
jgi:hypothetical protein